MIKFPPKKYKFLVVERIPGISYNMPYNVINGYGRNLKKEGAGDHIKHMIWVNKDGVADLCYEKQEFERSGDFIANKSLNHLSWLETRNLVVEKNASKYLQYAKTQLKINPSLLCC